MEVNPALKHFIIMRNSLFICVLTFFSFNSTASDYYWVGNTGNWSDLSHWASSSGGTITYAQLPAATDDVYFDANSFTIPSQAITLDVATMYAHNVSWLGVLNNPTCTGAFPNSLWIYGSLTLSQAMQMNYTGIIQFLSTTTGNTITSAGNVFLNTIIFYSAAGEWTLQDAFTSNSGISFVAGTLNTNDQAITCAAVFSISSFPRTLNLGASVLNFSGGNPWNVQNTGMTVNCGTSVINCTADEALFIGGSNGAVNTYNAVNFTSTVEARLSGYCNIHTLDFAGKANISGLDTLDNVVLHADAVIGGANVFQDLYFTAGHVYTLTAGSAQTINGDLHANGTCTQLITIIPSQIAAAIVTTDNIDVSYCRMRSIDVIGGGSIIANNSIDLCCNSGISFVAGAAETLYWIGNGGNWNDVNHWSYSSGGPPAACPPSATTNVIFDANSFSAPNQTVYIDVLTAYCKSMDWTGVTNSPLFDLPADKNFEIHGSLTFAAAMSTNLQGTVYFNATTPGQNITTGGHAFGIAYIRGVGGEWTLQDAFTSDRVILFIEGTLNTNGQTVNTPTFRMLPLYTSATLNMGASVFNLSGKLAWGMGGGSHINCGTSVINCTHDTATFDNSTFIAYNPCTFYDINFTGNNEGDLGGPLSVHSAVFFTANAYVSGPDSIHTAVFHGNGWLGRNNIFDDLNFTAGYTYQFVAANTQTIKNHWRILGNCTDSIKLQSTVAGSFANVRQATDSVRGNYLKITDIHATGGAAFMAYNSLDMGGNSGWNFSGLGPLGNPGEISGSDTVCQGATAVIFHLSPVPGAVSYEWTVPAGAGIVSGQGDTLIVVDFGTAVSGNITVQASNGCNLSASASNLAITILSVPMPAVTLNVTPSTSVCPGTVVTFTATATGTGSGAVTYDFRLNGISIQNGASGTYIATALSDADEITCAVTLSSTACFSAVTVQSDPVTMNVDPTAVNVNVNAGADGTITPGETIQLTGSGNIGTYLWSPSIGLSALDILNPIAAPAVSTVYTLTITDVMGCSGSDDVKVNVKEPTGDVCMITPMEAITPNGDGINDKWIVAQANCIYLPEVVVFNRYGSRVFHSQNYQNDWQGTYKGQPLPDGTYYAVITYRAANGNMIVKRINLTILR